MLAIETQLPSRTTSLKMQRSVKAENEEPHMIENIKSHNAQRRVDGRLSFFIRLLIQNQYMVVDSPHFLEA